jgi:hypothetical protein
MPGTLDPVQSRFRCGKLVFIIPSCFGVVWSRVDMATSKQLEVEAPESGLLSRPPYKRQGEEACTYPRTLLPEVPVVTRQPP